MWKQFVIGYDDDENGNKISRLAWINLSMISSVKKELDVEYSEDDEGNEISTVVEKIKIRVSGDSYYIHEITLDDLMKLLLSVPKNLPLLHGEKYVV